MNVRLSSTSSSSSVGATGTNKTPSSSSISSVPSITVNTVEVTPTTSPDENKGTYILPEDDCKSISTQKQPSCNKLVQP